MKNRLTMIGIKNAPDGKLQDGGGLTLAKTGLSGKWVYRYSHLGKRREMGLGAWPAVSLAEARKARDAWAAELAAGRDPIDARAARRAAEIESRDRSDPTFSELMQIVFDARRDTLRGDGERGRWLSPLRINIVPRMGRVRASEITRHVIADALRPIWRTMPPTAEKSLRRIRLILREGNLMGYGTDPIEADAAARILGDVRHTATPIPAVRWQDIPDVYAKLGDGPLADCLRFIILTAMRTEACAGARAEEFDGDVWTVPEIRMKGTERNVTAFRVPLSTEALRVATEAAKDRGELIFASYTGRRPTSQGMIKRLTVLGADGRPHGFRTTFRTWCQDHGVSWEVAETALGHTIGNRIERSYARSDLLERRRPVMQAWADFVTGAASNVTLLRGGGSIGYT